MFLPFHSLMFRPNMFTVENECYNELPCDSVCSSALSVVGLVWVAAMPDVDDIEGTSVPCTPSDDVVESCRLEVGRSAWVAVSEMTVSGLVDPSLSPPIGKSVFPSTGS